MNKFPEDGLEILYPIQDGKNLFCEATVTFPFDPQTVNQLISESKWTHVPNGKEFPWMFLKCHILQTKHVLKGHGEPDLWTPNMNQLIHRIKWMFSPDVIKYIAFTKTWGHVWKDSLKALWRFHIHRMGRTDNLKHKASGLFTGAEAYNFTIKSLVPKFSAPSFFAISSPFFTWAPA